MFFLQRIRRYFHERARNLFRFYDGTSWRRVDPLLAGIRLETVCVDYQDLLNVIARNSLEAPVGGTRDDLIRQKNEAVMTLAVASAKVFEFNLLPLVGSDAAVGLSHAEALGVLTKYFMFMRALAEDAALFQDSLATA